ncbi:hypothetical protein D5F01_LYC01451 [Larimichthys crocea]|uniref:PiggyBac transposable element-derived protein domain-containing protein n=1 Tax=Larimichthys crocea TaxID=215358 RepID=A0A6G0J5L8_LARCR|nr:hypothetical protein D5F01_LYC01451 [Larimichthys crocea]
MRRDRFFNLRSHLKVVIDDHVPEDRKSDKFWKVRPFMNRVLKGCHTQVRPESVSIDEQMIPFTGACPFRQYVPLKNFVLASAGGVVLDFEVYQGSKSLAAQDPDAEGLGLGALDSLTVVLERRMLSKVQDILDNDSHPLHELLERLRSSFSQRLLVPRCSTERHKKSFLPVSISLYNSSLNYKA